MSGHAASLGIANKFFLPQLICFSAVWRNGNEKEKGATRIWWRKWWCTKGMLINFHVVGFCIDAWELN